VRRLAGWRPIFFAAAFAFSLVALLPLRLAIGWVGLGGKGLAAREAEGSVWLGMLGEARFGGARLGDVTARLRALPLLLGRARLDIEQQQPSGLRAGLSATRHGVGIDDATGPLALEGVAGLPALQLDLSDLSVRFDDGLCAAADGRVRARISTEVAGLRVTASFAGEARCEGPALLLPLAGQSGADKVTARLFGDGRYAIELGISGYPARLSGEF
jgi:general secretion pathway protein N